MATNFGQLTPEQLKWWGSPPPIPLWIEAPPKDKRLKHEICLADTKGVPDKDIGAAIVHVLSIVPFDEIEQILFFGMSLLIVNRFGKPKLDIDFDFERDGFGQIKIYAKETNYGNQI